MSVSFTRLKDGSWGLRSADPLTEGATVAVTKRDGSQTNAGVGRLIWSGNGAHIYASVALAPAPRFPGPGSGPGSGNVKRTARPWRPCGYPGCHPSYCDECDGKGLRAGW